MLKYTVLIVHMDEQKDLTFSTFSLMNKSSSIKELATALNKVQSDLDTAKKDATNPFFHSKYLTLDGIISHIKPHLKDSGLSYVQGNSLTERGINIVTLLMHSSGEWIESVLPMPVAKTDPQSAGSAITYGRRYALASLFGIASEEDDDGEKTMDRAPRPFVPRTKPMGISYSPEKGYQSGYKVHA